MNRIQKAVSKYFQDGQTVIVGVSGGADSMTLLDSLMHCGKNLRLIVAHINHQLRQEESTRDEAFVRQYCEENALEFRLKQVDIQKQAKISGCSIEVCGRIERYRFFSSLCPEDGKIATAHTLSDRTETMLFHMIRGTSVTGLSSIPRKRGKIVRPLIDFTRMQIEDYCQTHAVPFVNDSTNQSTVYTRNKIRIELLPLMREINPCLEQHIGNLAEGLSEDDEYLFSHAKQYYKKIFYNDRLSIENWKAIPSPLKSRVLVLFLKEKKVSYDYQAISTLLSICEQQQGRCSLSSDYEAFVLKKQLLVEKKQAPCAPFSYLITPFCAYYFQNLQNLRVEFCDIGNYADFLNSCENSFISALDYDKIKGTILLRQRLPGDTIRLSARPNKSLKKLMNENCIPVYVRSRLAVLSDENGLLWVQNVGIDVRVCVSENTQNLLLLVWDKQNIER